MTRFLICEMGGFVGISWGQLRHVWIGKWALFLNLGAMEHRYGRSMVSTGNDLEIVDVHLLSISFHINVDV
jgi:hypothetical protein